MQSPAEPDRAGVVAKPGNLGALNLHVFGGGLAEQPGAVGRNAPVEVQPGERQHALDIRRDQAGGPDAPRQPPDRYRLVLARAFAVPGGDPVPDRLLGQGDGLGEAERPDQALAQGRIPYPAVEHLDDPPEQDEPAVAVRVRRARREDLCGPAELADVAFDALVPAASIGEDVAVDAAGVREQVADRDLFAGVLAADADAGQDRRNGGIQRHGTLVDDMP